MDGVHVRPVLARKVKGTLLFAVTVLAEDIAAELRRYFHYHVWEHTAGELEAMSWDSPAFRRATTDHYFDVTYNGMVLNYGLSRTFMGTGHGLPLVMDTDAVGYKHLVLAGAPS